MTRRLLSIALILGLSIVGARSDALLTLMAGSSPGTAGGGALTQALMIYGGGSTLQNAFEVNLFGHGTTGTEIQTQTRVMTANATFSKLAARITAGGSGTNNFQFRNNTTDGNMLASIAGTGLVEDNTNTDTVVAGDEFNIAYTDNGTDSTVLFVRGNVAFAGGNYGNIHGSGSFGAGAVLNVASSTRYQSISGEIVADGTTTIANAQWANRGYDTIEALCVNVSLNARTNDTTFRVNVNGTDTGSTLTFAAGVTGISCVSGLAIAIDNNDLIAVSHTLGTGTESLTIRLVTVEMMSNTTGKSEIFAHDTNGLAIAASGTEAFFRVGGQLSANGDTEANTRIRVGFAARMNNLRLYLSANTYSTNGTLTLYKAGSAVCTVTVTAAATGWLENTGCTSSDTNDTDEISFGIVGGTSGSITVHGIGVTFGPISFLQPANDNLLTYPKVA